MVKPVAAGIPRRFHVKRIRQFDENLPCHGECHARLQWRHLLDPDKDQRAAVDNDGERRQPRLITVLRSVVSEHWVREMTLQEFRAPAFPFPQQNDNLTEAVLSPMTLQQAQGRRRRAGAAVKPDHRRLPTREQLVQHRQIADDDGNEAEAGPGFENCE